MTTIKIDPLSRIEGHLKIETDIEEIPNSPNQKFKVHRARSSGLMFRGVEILLEGRDPMDAHQITQRICGVCPIAHGIASCLAQENAYGAEPSHNGRLIQNLIFAANFIQSHILHFYHLVALDFVDIKAILQYTGKDPQLNAVKRWAQSELKSNKINPVAPFLPRSEGDYLKDSDVNIGALANYLQALDMRALSHEMAAVFGGKIPHVTAFLPTGATANATIDVILRYQTRLETLTHFIEQNYLPDVVAIAKAYPQYFKIGRGPENYMSYGGMHDANGDYYFKPGVIINGSLERFNQDLVAEDVRYSFYSSRSGTHPYEATTTANPNKAGAYSWIKAPRYKRKVMQVGPLARTMVHYRLGTQPQLKKMVDNLLKDVDLELADLNSVMGRHAARAFECKLLAEKAAKWLSQLRPGEPASNKFSLPKKARGYGCTEAPRGSVGHWLRIKDYVIESYQCVVPTTWNCSPRDDQGQPGAVEQALEGCPVAAPEHPIEPGRVVRSFDPCLACSIH